MSYHNLEKDIDPTPLIDVLVSKTKEGKLKWEPTASEDAFIASAGGDHTLKIYLDAEEYAPYEEFPVLALLDSKGKTLWKVTPAMVKSGLWPLFKLAQRIAHKLDDRIAGLVETLQRL